MNKADDINDVELAYDAWWESIEQAQVALCQALRELGYRHTRHTLGSLGRAGSSTRTYRHKSGNDVVLVIQEECNPDVKRLHVKTTNPAIFDQLNLIAQHTDKYYDAWSKAREEEKIYQALEGTRKRKLVARFS